MGQGHGKPPRSSGVWKGEGAARRHGPAPDWGATTLTTKGLELVPGPESNDADEGAGDGETPAADDPERA